MKHIHSMNPVTPVISGVSCSAVDTEARSPAAFSVVVAQSLICVQLFGTARAVDSLLRPWDFPDQNTEVDCRSLLWRAYMTFSYCSLTQIRL